MASVSTKGFAGSLDWYTRVDRLLAEVEDSAIVCLMVFGMFGMGWLFRMVTSGNGGEWYALH
jgi:hypothetical protein